MENNSETFDVENNGNKKNMSLNIDEGEYMQIFKLFDKDNSGEINIDEVYEMIQKFEQGSNKNLQTTDPKIMQKIPMKNHSAIKQSRTQNGILTNNNNDKIF